jgi:hypothetical protein
MAATNPWEFLQAWAGENVHATVYDDKAEARRLAFECREAAKAAGVSEYGVIKAAGGDLQGWLLIELNEAVDREVNRLVEKDKT